MKNLKTLKLLGEEWYDLLAKEFDQPYMQALRVFLADELKKSTVYPNMRDVFRAFELTPPSLLKVVILGQDPYHNVGQAHGLSFSVLPPSTPPPSLVNIFKEIKRDMAQKGVTINNTQGDLRCWARQGVLLLNAILTVRAHCPASHRNVGWETFTEQVIKVISEKLQGVVFMLWGAFAQQKENLIDQSKHLVLKTSHPSPFSVDRGFKGCSHFSQANDYLLSHNKKAIDWSNEISGQ